MMIRELVVTLSFLSIPAAAVVVFGGTAAPLLTPSASESPPAFAVSPAGKAATAYAANCAACHGADARGTERAPALIGPGGLVGTLPRTALAEVVATRHADLKAVGVTDNAVSAALGDLDELARRRALATN